MGLVVGWQARGWRVGFVISLALAAGWAISLLQRIVAGSGVGGIVWAAFMLTVWAAVGSWTRDRARFNGWQGRATTRPAVVAASTLVAIIVVVTATWSLHMRAVHNQNVDAAPGSGSVSFGDSGGHWPLPAGEVSVLTSSGHGRWETIPFAFRGDPVSAVVSATGNVDFRIIEAMSGVTASTVSCQTGCASTRWGGPRLAGLYRLRIDTQHDDTDWTISLRETRTPTFEFAAWLGPGGFSLLSDGTGSARSAVFQLMGKPAPTGGVRLGGLVRVSGPAAFYLVPNGSTLDRNRDLIYRASSSEGGWSGAHPAGTYRLVVETVGQWSLSSDP